MKRPDPVSNSLMKCHLTDTNVAVLYVENYRVKENSIAKEANEIHIGENEIHDLASFFFKASAYLRTKERAKQYAKVIEIHGTGNVDPFHEAEARN